MKLTQRTIKHLRKHINGDGEGADALKHGKYRGGPRLVDLFVELGLNDTYEQGFPSRWEYTESRINKLNNSSDIKNLLETVFDRLEYDCSAKEHIDVIDDMNLYLERDGYRMDISKGRITVRSTTGNQVYFAPPPEIELLSNDFIRDNIQKCDKKLSDGDYRGAITNARSLCEDVFTGLERKLNPNVKNTTATYQNYLKD